MADNIESSTQQAVLSDFDSHSHAMELPIGAVVQELIDLLGLTIVAVIGGVRETRAVQQWTNGRKPQRQNVLRFALQLATMIASKSGGEIARAWFEGSNPHLDDASPTLLLRNSPLSVVQGPLMAAARAFASRHE